MKTCFNLIIVLSVLVLSSCNNNSKAQTSDNKSLESFIEEVEQLPEPTTTSKQLFAIESAYIKFSSKAAGQEMTREWRFDQFGRRQSEEYYFMIMDQKAGHKTIVFDDFQYQWDYDATEGRKSKFYQTVTDYEKVSQRDIERYGIATHGYEEILGKKCLKVSIEKPAKSTIWVWNGIALKTESVIGNNTLHMEAIEIDEGAIKNAFFELPENVKFPDSIK